MINYSNLLRLTQIANRRTIDRRFQVLPIGDIISTMGNLFVSRETSLNSHNDISASVDSSMLKAAGPVWHKSDIKKNRLPISGIDTNAKWENISLNPRVGYLGINCI